MKNDNRPIELLYGCNGLDQHRMDPMAFDQNEKRTNYIGAGGLTSNGFKFALAYLTEQVTNQDCSWCPT